MATRDHIGTGGIRKSEGGGIIVGMIVVRGEKGGRGGVTDGKGGEGGKEGRGEKTDGKAGVTEDTSREVGTGLIDEYTQIMGVFDVCLSVIS